MNVQTALCTGVIALTLWLPPSASAQFDHAAPRDPFVAARDRLVQTRIATAGVTNSRVLDAIRNTLRHEFVPQSQWSRAYFDMALPIGESQTISSPFIVASMTEALDPQPGDRVLEIGTGSGYQAAVLSPLVEDVYTIEIVRPLGKIAAQTLQRLGYENVHTRIGDGFLGWPEAAPFDKIIVTCSPESVPAPLVDQLREGGQMIVPVGERYQQTLYRMIKRDGELVRQPLRQTLFVPMTGEAEENRQQKPDPSNPRIVNGNFELTHWTDQAALDSPSEAIEADLPSESPSSDSVDQSHGDAGGSGRDLADQDNPQVAGWYYGRQVRLARGPGGQCVRFENQTPGLASHLLQGIAIDGRVIRSIRLSTKYRTESVRPGPSADEVPMLAISFYDDVRADLGAFTIGPFRGTRDWKSASRLIQVPPAAREAIVRIGLFGATGVAEFDDVEIEVRR